jgi:glycosyltransferase involved in cell wall biosynthesis
MKILHVISSLSTEHGGPITFVRDLAIAHVRLGHSVTILTASSRTYGFISHSNEVRNLSSHGVSVFSFSSISFYRLSPRLFLWACMNLGKYDVVHMHSLYRFPVDISIMLSRIKSIPAIISPHGSLDPYLHSKSAFGGIGVLLKRFYHFVYRFILRDICFHFTTLDEKKLAAAVVTPRQTFVIPIGISLLADTACRSNVLRNSIKSSDRDIVIGHIGRFHHKKNILNLIRSFHVVHAAHPSSWLILIGPEGDKDYMSLLRNVAEAGAASKRVVFWGPISHEQVNDYLADIDIFALPSFTENFGIAILEAMASCKPVVVSTNVNIHSLISRYNAGLVAGIDVDSIVAAILSLVRMSPHDRIQLGHNGRCLVNAEFSPEAISRQYLDAYSSLAHL